MLCAGFFSGCSPAGEQKSELSGDWIEVSADAPFSLLAPSGTLSIKGGGKDSITGSFEGPGSNLIYDYGRYSDPLTARADDTDYNLQELEIDGKQARLITSRRSDWPTDAPYFIGIHFPEIQTSGNGGVRLTIYAQVGTRADYATVERAFGGIRFTK